MMLIKREQNTEVHNFYNEEFFAYLIDGLIEAGIDEDYHFRHYMLEKYFPSENDLKNLDLDVLLKHLRPFIERRLHEIVKSYKEQS